MKSGHRVYLLLALLYYSFQHLTMKHLPRLLGSVQIPRPGWQESLALLETNSILLQRLQESICLCALIRLDEALQVTQTHLGTPLGEHLSDIHIRTGVSGPVELLLDRPFLGTRLQDDSTLIMNNFRCDVLVRPLQLQPERRGNGQLVTLITDT